MNDRTAKIAELKTLFPPAKKPRTPRAKPVAIKARARNQFGDRDFYKPYLRKTFALDSLSALSTEQLRRTYNWIMAKEAPSARA